MRFFEKYAVDEIVEVISFFSNIHDGPADLLWFCIFQQVTVGAILHHMRYKALVFVHAQYNDMDVWVLFADDFRCFNSILSRHTQVHKDHIWLCSRKAIQKFVAILSFQHEFNIGKGTKRKDDALTKYFVIV